MKLVRLVDTSCLNAPEASTFSFTSTPSPGTATGGVWLFITWRCHSRVSASWFSSRPPSMLFQNCLLRQTDPGCITRLLVLVSVAPAVIGATSRKVGIAISWPVKYGSSPPNSPPANYHWYNPWDQVFCCRIFSIDGQEIISELWIRSMLAKSCWVTLALVTWKIINPEALVLFVAPLPWLEKGKQNCSIKIFLP